MEKELIDIGTDEFQRLTQKKVLPNKGVEHSLSLHIRLGAMDFLSNNLEEEDLYDLFKMISMRNLAKASGVEQHLRINTPVALMKAVEAHRRDFDNRPRRVEKPLVDPRVSKILDIQEALRRMRIVGPWAAAAVVLGLSTGVLMHDRYVERTSAFDQKNEALVQLIDPVSGKLSDRIKVKHTVYRNYLVPLDNEIKLVVESFERAQAKINDLDDWNSLGAAVKGFATMFSSAGTMLTTIITFAGLKNGKLD